MNEEQFIVRGPELVYDPPTESLGTVLLKRMEEYGDKTVHINALDGSSESFASLRSRSICIAENMRRHGIGKGDNISICSRNQANAFATAIAGILIGAPVNGLEPELTTNDLKYLLNLIQPKAVFCDQEGLTAIKAAVSGLRLNTLLVVYEGEDSDCIQFSEFLKQIEEEHEFKPAVVENLKEAIAFIVCTSGSTGNPKGVMISHFSVIGVYQHYYEQFKKLNINQERRMFLFASLYWIGGITAYMYCLFCGFTRVFVPKPFSEKVALEIFQTYKPAVVSLPTPMVNRLVKYPDISKYDCSSIVVMLVVGTKPSAEICTKLQDLLPNGVTRISYGMTETLNIIATTTNNDSNFNTLGKLSEGVTAKIIDVISGKALGRKQAGELLVKYDFLMQGYYKNPEETAKTIDKDGWLHTGDMCYFDEEGYLFYVDRVKEMLKFQNHSFSAIEIEDELLKHPAVVDCCVVGLPHKEYGHLLVAFAFLIEGAQSTEAELKTYVNDRVSDHKKLRGGVILLEHMPVLPSGKIKRKYLAAKAMEMKEELLSKAD